MIKLVDIHQEMNNKKVLEAADQLYREWMWRELDGLENDARRLRRYTTVMFRRAGCTPSEDQLLAAKTLFHIKVGD